MVSIKVLERWTHVLSKQIIICALVRADTISRSSLFHALAVLRMKNRELILSGLRAPLYSTYALLGTGFHRIQTVRQLSLRDLSRA